MAGVEPVQLHSFCSLTRNKFRQELKKSVDLSFYSNSTPSGRWHSVTLVQIESNDPFWMTVAGRAAYSVYEENT